MITAQEFTRRRRDLMATMSKNSIAILTAAPAQVRSRDVSIAREEHELGVFALAVPLRNMQGKAVAALNVVSSAERMDSPQFQRDMLPLLQDAARELRPLL